MKTPKSKSPIIKVLKVTECKNGDALIDFEYQKDFIDLMIKELKLKKKPTKKQIGAYILKLIEDTIEDKEKNEKRN